MITLTFESYEEMRKYAQQLLGLPTERKESTSAPMPVTLPQETYQPQTQPQAITPPPITAVPVRTAPTTTMPIQQPTVPTQPVVMTAPVQTSTITYNLDDLSRAAMPLMDAGKQEDLIRLVGQFGVASLQDLPPDQYGAFATALRGLGAQI